MQGDKIIVEAHHSKAAKKIVAFILPQILSSNRKYSLNVAGESGSGKSEIATAISNELKNTGIGSIILQQDDYFVYPPRTNDRTRRKNIDGVGPQEVHIDLLDRTIKAFLNGQTEIEKPWVLYDEDKITKETLSIGDATVAIAEGTYTSLLQNIDTRTFIDRSYIDTMEDRLKRQRHPSELDDFTTEVLKIEHGIIYAHKLLADLIITKEYDVEIRQKH